MAQITHQPRRNQQGFTHVFIFFQRSSRPPVLDELHITPRHGLFRSFPRVPLCSLTLTSSIICKHEIVCFQCAHLNLLLLFLGTSCHQHLILTRQNLQIVIVASLQIWQQGFTEKKSIPTTRICDSYVL